MMLGTIGWVIMHSLWQWTLIAGVTALLLGLLRNASARTRYAVGCGSIGLMLIGSTLTAATSGSRGPTLRHDLLYAFDGALIIPPITPNGFMILRVAAAVWLCGLCLCVVRFVMAWRRAHALRWRQLEDVTGGVDAIVDELCRQMHVRVPVDVRCSTRAAVPMLLGARRPLILLPPHTLQQLTAEQLRTVLAHELAHVQRGDYRANVAQAIADLLVFHHPGARWVSRCVRTEREYCCDDIAVALTGDEQTYARALAALEDGRSDQRLAVAAASGTLLDRVQRIVRHPRPVLTAAHGAVVFVITAVLAAALLAIAINVPPPWVPAGVRIRRPPPRAAKSLDGPRVAVHGASPAGVRYFARVDLPVAVATHLPSAPAYSVVVV